MDSPKLLTPTDWRDYELLDSGGFEKLERFGQWIVARPEPQAMWNRSLPDGEWARADATFRREARSDERGEWVCNPRMPRQWWVEYARGAMRLRMKLSLTALKHVGLFPEQAANWNFLYDNLLRMRGATMADERSGGVGTAGDAAASGVDGLGAKSAEAVAATGAENVSAGQQRPAAPLRVLNLFAYTGGATLAAAAAGAEVTHVDSVKQVVGWARENATENGLENIRWIVDDAMKFARREVARGRTYHAIVLDPPAYGRGPDGEKWVLEQNINELLTHCARLLEPHNSLLILNLYSMGLSALLAKGLVNQIVGPAATEEFGELYFADRSAKPLPLGIYYRMTR